MYFPFFKPQTGNKRFAAQPQTIYSEFPKIPEGTFAEAAFGDLHYSFAQPLAHCRALCQPRIRSF